MPWVVDMTGKEAPRSIPVGDLIPREIAVSSDGKRFALSAAGKGITIGSLRGDPGLRVITAEPGDSDPCFRRGDAKTQSSRPLSSQLVSGRYWGLHFSLDGKRVAVVRGDTDLLEIDVATGAILRTMATPGADALFSPTYTQLGLLVVRVRWEGNVWIADATF
jgi:hypothetical protein